MNRFTFSFVLLLSVLISKPSKAQSFQDYTLNGLDTLNVYVNLDAGFLSEKRIKSIESVLQEQLELELRRSNIIIGSNEEGAHLQFYVLALEISNNSYTTGKAFSYSLTLDQLVKFDRSPLPFLGTTWEKAGISIISNSDDFKNELKSYLDDVITAYLNAYYRVNE